MSTETRTETADRQDRRTGSVFDIARFEGERRLRISGILAVLFALFGGLFVALAPDLIATQAFDDIFDAMPPAIVALTGFEYFGSIEGIVSGEFYTFTWVVGLGAYLAYSAAGSVAGDLKNDRMDTLLAAPISRTKVLLGKYLGLLVPIVVLNVVIPLVIYGGSVLVDDPIALADLAALHALSVPYLLMWAAFGLLVGVVVRRGRTAGRAAMGVVFATWLLESFVTATDFEWVGAISPMRYFDPADILVNGEYGVTGAALLLVVAVVFVAASQTVFSRSDL